MFDKQSLLRLYVDLFPNETTTYQVFVSGTVTYGSLDSTTVAKEKCLFCLLYIKKIIKKIYKNNKTTDSFFCYLYRENLLEISFDCIWIFKNSPPLFRYMFKFFFISFGARRCTFGRRTNISNKYMSYCLRIFLV